MAWREPGAGELNRRVTVRKRVDYPDDHDGGLESAYPAQSPRWAKIEPVGTAVYTAGVQTDQRVTHRIILRHLPGVTDSHEVVRGDTVYRVRRSADMNGEQRFTVLEVEEL
ncbi:phage head closure protein [Pseudomonas sp. GD03721]|nr:MULTISPECIES: phage head closure protein [unclassified Pseudomonas]MDH1442056.1 phage head closure protein [Pseudomonas sp. GD03722]WGG02696.1 phage head closure protein [Pseudomonas sp. GD03721]WGG06864.1 phage head closure protein [Pseudomonas sp. GD03919]